MVSERLRDLRTYVTSVLNEPHSYEDETIALAILDYNSFKGEFSEDDMEYLKEIGWHEAILDFLGAEDDNQ